MARDRFIGGAGSAPGFQWQTTGACGTFAIQHALLLLGWPVRRDEIRRRAGTPARTLPFAGTSEDQVVRGLRGLGCKAKWITFKSPEKARAEADAALRRGCPCIISTDAGDHWAVLAGMMGDKYIWIDPVDDDLIGAWSWERIAAWMASGADEGEDEYGLIVVAPARDSDLRFSIVPRFAEAWDLLRDDDLCELWGYYLEDLREAFDCPEPGRDAVSAVALLERFGAELLDSSIFYVRDSNVRKMKWELSCYQKVAAIHGLTVSADHVPMALIRMASALTAISATGE